MSNDDWYRKAKELDREFREVIRKYNIPLSTPIPLPETIAEEMARIDRMTQRVALDELFADVFGSRSYECLEAETLKNSGIIPPWRPYPNPSEKGG